MPRSASNNTPSTAPRPDAWVLRIALLLLTVLYVAWHLPARNFDQLAITALPPLLLAIAAFLGARTAGFWAGVLALLWFSHGVMMAWAHPSQRLFASAETLLALVIVFASSYAGLRSRFAGTAKKQR